MKKLDKNSGTPLYEQLIIALQEDIQRKVYKYGEQIPTEPELEEIYGVSRIVVRKSITILEEKGYVVKRRGKGTFVSYPKVVESFNANGSFTKSCNLLGIEPKTIIVNKKELSKNEIPDYISNELKSDRILLIERLRLADNQEVIFELDYLRHSYQFIMDYDLENIPIMNIIRENRGLIASYFEDIVDVVPSDKRLEEIFQLDEQEHLLRVTQKVLTQENELIYLNIQFIRSKIYQYAIRYGGN